MSYNYALSKILPTFATFTNEFSPFFPLLYPPFYTSAYSSFRQTLLLSIQNSFSSISLLLPPSSPPVKISNFHPPSLSCIPPEGRLSSFPISSPLSLSAPSLVPPHLPDSFYRSSANSHGGGESDTPAQTHAPSSFVNAVSSDGGKLRQIPTHAHSCMSDPTSAKWRLGITPDIKGSRSEPIGLTESLSVASRRWNGNLTSFPSLETSLRSDSQWLKLH